MSSITFLKPEDQATLERLQDDFTHKVRLTGCCVLGASFLIIGALIVITCGCLCLTLPGVNVISSVILPAVVPGCCGLVLSTPFVALAVKYSKNKNTLRTQIIEQMIEFLEEYEVPDEPSLKIREKFIRKNFLKRTWAKEYQSGILEDIKEKIGTSKEERNPRQEAIAEALDEVGSKINSKKKQS